MNLAALRTAVYARLGVDSTDGMFTSTILNGFINDANHQIELLHDWPWLQDAETVATVAGTDSYTPGGFNADGFLWHRTVELRDGVDATVLERFSVTELDDRWLPSERGKPREFAIFGDKLILRPTPDAVYSIIHRYIRQEADLVSDTDTPTMPAAAHAAIAELATYIALRRDRNDPRAVGAEQAYQQWINQLQIDKRRYETPGRVRVRPGGWV